MPFVKEQKNRDYFRRFQTKFRRRREGKTDYRRRTILIRQDKNKYNTPKWRIVVRISNRDITTQVVRAKIIGDEVMCAAYAHELPRYGIALGLTNYAAAYATGLLLARRVLAKLKLEKQYLGAGEEDDLGEDYYVDPVDDGPMPFFALLDIGLARASTGARVFATLKGVCDGGVEVPHKETRFVGYDDESKQLNGDVLRSHLLGGHVADYMRVLKDADEDAYNKQFSAYVKAGIDADSLEKIYLDAHKKIRADPSFKPSKKADKKTVKPFAKRRGKMATSQRRARVLQKIASHIARKEAQEAEE